MEVFGRVTDVELDIDEHVARVAQLLLGTVQLRDVNVPGDGRVVRDDGGHQVADRHDHVRRVVCKHIHLHSIRHHMKRQHVMPAEGCGPCGGAVGLRLRVTTAPHRRRRKLHNVTDRH